MIDIDMIWVEHELTVTFLRELVWRLFYVSFICVQIIVMAQQQGISIPTLGSSTFDQWEPTESELKDIARVCCTIRLSLNSEDGYSVLNIKNPIKIIEKLKDRYKGGGAKTAPELFEEYEKIFIKKVLPKEFADVCKSYEIQCLGRPESEHMSDTIFENELLKVERENAKNKLAGSTDGSVSLASTSQKKDDGLRVTKSKKKSEIKCFACGEIGHMKFQCKKRKSKRGSKDTEETARKDVTLCSIFNSKNLVG
ncbi:hypothetical protein SSS_02728 [Sarcoptes scabiei]|uniref:CCHC-type domain-containing protein n=1 Tax=Sarcoptes scabiei TaxID=52283 RepID=A0A834VHP5_SARSC|nr:hypothetical protein SSS_02728 [Sarcoptes scabiei]